VCVFLFLWALIAFSVLSHDDGVQAILSRHDAYIDCYLRLACISRRMGSSSEAISWATKALELQGGHADALALMSQLYLERR
jgi:RNA polymerase-associated protein CTR9